MLFLFDIDGTLVLTGGAGLRALERAVLDLFGVKGAAAGIAFDGMTDPLILAEIFARNVGARPTTADLDAVLERYLVHLEDEVARAERYRIMPGVTGALEALARRGALVGLATGNVERGARIKLERGDPWRRFPFGGFGSDAADRALLVARAIERAEARAGRRFPPEETFVVGDTPRDVAAAHACGAVALAVATGPHSVEALRAAEADAVFTTLEDLPGWLG